jgi:hypothetical protein
MQIIAELISHSISLQIPQGASHLEAAVARLAASDFRNLGLVGIPLFQAACLMDSNKPGAHVAHVVVSTPSFALCSYIMSPLIKSPRFVLLYRHRPRCSDVAFL